MRIRYFSDSIANAREALIQNPSRFPASLNYRIARDLVDVAIRKFAIGEDAGSSTTLLREALTSYAQVVSSRGVESAFETYVVPSGSKEFVPMNPPGGRDFSIGNSATTFAFCCVALVVQDLSALQNLVDNIWDPPDADYFGWVGHTTPAARYRAYAFKGLISGQPEQAVDLASKVFPKRKWDWVTRFEADLIVAIAKKSPEGFLRGIEKLMSTVDSLARMKQNRFETDCYISLPGLGLSFLAVKEGLLTLDQIPEHPRLAKELLTEVTR